jgi:hypothetical protein
MAAAACAYHSVETSGITYLKNSGAEDDLGALDDETQQVQDDFLKMIEDTECQSVPNGVCLPSTL